MAIFCTVTGNLGADGELKQTQANKVVCNFRVASKGRDRNAEATWVRCALWGMRAEKVAPYLKRGGRVAVSGTLSTTEYNGKTQLDLDVFEIELLGDGNRSEDSRPAPQQQRRAPVQRNLGDRSDEEVPF